MNCGAHRRGCHFAVDSISPIFVVLHLKLASTMILKKLYSIEKCAMCLDTFSKILELTVCRIIKKIYKKVYTSVKTWPHQLNLTDAKSCMFNCVWGQYK